MTKYDDRQAEFEKQRARARAAYDALTTPHGLDEVYPHSRSEHGWKYPAARKARRVIANCGKRIRVSDEKAMRKHRKRSMQGMVRAAERRAQVRASKG